MALEVRIDGAATLHRVAAHIRAEGSKDLGRELGNALGKAVEPIKKSIKASAEETMPRRGGYDAVFVKSLNSRITRNSRGSSTSVTLATYADGKSERRDIRALERGDLRHPVFGHRKHPWTVTHIRAGFHKRGTDHALDEAQKQLSGVVADFAKRLID